MKTRIIQTRFWDDPVVMECSKEATLLWIFLITNKDLGMTNYVHIPDPLISFYTKLDAKQLKSAKQELEGKGKIFFHENWVFYPKLEDQNKYKNAPNNEAIYAKEMQHVPEDVKAYFTSVYTSTDTTMATSSHSRHKYINNKSKIKNNKNTSTSIDSTIMQKFEDFWLKYPRKVNKKKAAEKYAKIAEHHEAIMAGLDRHLPVWAKTDPQYIPHPLTWLHGERWNDEVAGKKKNFEAENSKPYEDLF